jgi:hypothetical protein
LPVLAENTRTLKDKSIFGAIDKFVLDNRGRLYLISRPEIGVKIFTHSQSECIRERLHHALFEVTEGSKTVST